jgi:hypothetical protein
MHAVEMNLVAAVARNDWATGFHRPLPSRTTKCFIKRVDKVGLQEVSRKVRGARKGSGWACPDFSDTEFRVIWFGLVDVRTQQG